jgi:hypothetical protein
LTARLAAAQAAIEGKQATEAELTGQVRSGQYQTA